MRRLFWFDYFGELGTYVGSFSDKMNKPHGYGRIVFKNSRKYYQGDWLRGSWNGRGRAVDENGTFYEGEFFNNRKHGHGKSTFTDGRVFEGRYFGGKERKGTMKYSDGSTYSADFLDGMRHGKGECRSHRGALLYKGVFVNDFLCFRETTAKTYEVSGITWKDSDREEGTYAGSVSELTGMPHGFGRIEYGFPGKFYEGEWVHGHWTGDRGGYFSKQ